MVRVGTLIAASCLSAATAGEIQSCTWNTQTGKLDVEWEASSGSDYYEVNVKGEQSAQTSGIFSTKFTKASIGMLVQGKSYSLSIRSHKSGQHSLGPGTWNRVGSSKECQTGHVGTATNSSESLDLPAPRSAKAETFFLEVMRESEFTNDIDYLMNHASGDVLGDAALMSAIPNSPWGEFRDATFTLYCVEVLKVSVPGTVTTGDDDRFADYISCNNNHDPSNPKCTCDEWIDRDIASQSKSMCHSRGGGPCSFSQHHPPECVCDCSSESTSNSAKYTGMMPVHFQNAEELGHWYSHPAATECAEDEEVGQMRSDGSQCTWRRQPEARVVYGQQVLEHGFRQGGGMRVSPSMAKSNKEAFLKTFAAQGLTSRACPVSVETVVTV